MRHHIILPLLIVLVTAGCPGASGGGLTLAEATLRLRDGFAAADADGDGRLSPAEARAYLPALTAAQFRTLDQDGSGYVEPGELGLSAGEGEGEGEGEEEPRIPVFYTYQVQEMFPHDTNAFTQGFVYDDGALYEGTGLVGRSSLRRVDLPSGAIEQQVDLPSPYFGEGVDVWDTEIVQLTWRHGRGFVYARDTFASLREFRYSGEGWGITHDEHGWIMSDGTHLLRILDRETFAVERQLAVHDRGEPVRNLNELEYIQGEIWANVWQTDLIARIDPASGEVVGWVDLSGLLTPEQRRTADVLNGIAYDAANDRILVTGKFWPFVFHITVFPAGDSR